MADRGGTTGRVDVCNDTCGCASPCPGGLSFSCYTTTGIPSADDPSIEHKKCSCGEHCGCNPCTCTKRLTAASGCKCGAGCTCVPCSA